MEEIFKIKENYTMGFISPHEFLNELQDVLMRVGGTRRVGEHHQRDIGSACRFYRSRHTECSR